MTNIAAKELGRYGVTANAIAPAALTRVTENLGFGQAARDVEPATFDAYDRMTSRPWWCGGAARSPPT